MPVVKQRQSSSRLSTPNPELLLKQYEQMMTLAGDILYTTDADGYCTHISSSVEVVLGYRVEDVIGIHFTDLAHPDWKRDVYEFYQRQIHHLIPRTIFQFPMVTQGGMMRQVEQIVMLIDDDGKVGGLQVLVHNMTPDREIRDDLMDAGDHFFAVAHKAHVALFVARSGRIAYANQSLENLIGANSESPLLNGDVLDFIAPVDRSQVEAALLTETPQKEPFIHREIRLFTRKDDERWIDLSISPIHFDDQPAVVGTAFEITDRKKAETERQNYIQRLEVIQGVDGDLTKSLKSEYVLKIALKAAVDISKADAGAIHLVDEEALKVAQVIGNFPSSMIGSHVPVDRGIVGRVFRNRKAELVCSVQDDPDYIPNVIETRAQMTLPLLVGNSLLGVLNVQTAEPDIFTAEQYEFIRVLAARIASALENARLFDASQHQLAEMQLLYEQVSALEQIKTQMIRVAAHDLRNPLGVISGYLQMINWENEATLNERSQEHFRVIREAIGRIDKITRDILTLERVSAGQEIRQEQIDLCEIVTTTSKEFLTQANDKLLRYEVEMPSSPTMVQGDRILLHETVGNLISNAIKYTPEKGSIRMRLTVKGNQAVFEVEDDGYGIPEDQQENLFKPFYRVKLKETRSVKGTGLGLHLVKNIIEQHQGHMHFSSTYQKGSIFGFDLPLAGKAKRRPRKHDDSTAAES